MVRVLNNIILQASSVSTMNYFKEFISDGPSKFILCLLTGLMSTLSSFLVPIWTTLFAVGMLIIVDAVLGTMASMSFGNRFESRRLWSTIKKLGWSTMIICCAHLMDLYIITSLDAHLVEFFAGMIGGVELWSMVENLQTLDPTGPWRIFGKFIRSKGEKYLDITISKEDLPKIKKMVKKIK